MLALEPEGEYALPSPQGVRFLGIEATRTERWPALRHVFDLGEEAGLHVLVDGRGHVTAFGVSYDMFACDELLTPL